MWEAYKVKLNRKALKMVHGITINVVVYKEEICGSSYTQLKQLLKVKFECARDSMLDKIEQVTYKNERV